MILVEISTADNEHFFVNAFSKKNICVVWHKLSRIGFFKLCNLFDHVAFGWISHTGRYFPSVDSFMAYYKDFVK